MEKRDIVTFCAIIGLAFAVRAIFLIAVGNHPNQALTPDSVEYLQEAKNISLHTVFSNSESPPWAAETVRTPGYPLFLGVFCRNSGEINIPFVLWMQALLGALTCGLVYIAALWLWESSRAALAAGVGLAFDVVTVLHTGLVLTETLYLFGFTLSLLLLIKAFSMGPRSSGRWLVYAGFGFGLVSLIRPVGLYYPLLVTVVIAQIWRTESRGLVLSGIFLVSSLLAPMGWMTRNRAEVGTWTFSSVQGLNFVVRAAAVQAEISGLSADQSMKKTQEDIRKSHPQDFASPAEEAAYSGRWSLRFIACHPLVYSIIMVKDVFKLLGGHGMEIGAWLLLKDASYDPMHPAQMQTGHFRGTMELLHHHPLLGIFFIGYVMFLAVVYWLAGKGFLAAWRLGQTSEAILVFTPIFYFIIVTAGLTAYYRLRLPLMPAMFILAGRGIQSLGKTR